VDRGSLLQVTLASRILSSGIIATSNEDLIRTNYSTLVLSGNICIKDHSK
jgi:hypothetical protein